MPRQTAARVRAGYVDMLNEVYQPDERVPSKVIGALKRELDAQKTKGA